MLSWQEARLHAQGMVQRNSRATLEREVERLRNLARWVYLDGRTGRAREYNRRADTLERELTRDGETDED